MDVFYKCNLASGFELILASNVIPCNSDSTSYFHTRGENESDTDFRAHKETKEKSTVGLIMLETLKRLEKRAVCIQRTVLDPPKHFRSTNIMSQSAMSDIVS